MYLSTIFLASLASLAMATPLPKPQEGKPTSAGVYACREWGFDAKKGNYCYHYTMPFNQCTNINDRFPAGTVEGLSSVGPDPGVWCTMYKNEGCTGDELDLINPGYFKLEEIGWNDIIKSFNCAAL